MSGFVAIGMHVGSEAEARVSDNPGDSPLLTIQEGARHWVTISGEGDRPKDQLRFARELAAAAAAYCAAVERLAGRS